MGDGPTTHQAIDSRGSRPWRRRQFEQRRGGVGLRWGCRHTWCRRWRESHRVRPAHPLLREVSVLRHHHVRRRRRPLRRRRHRRSAAPERWWRRHRPWLRQRLLVLVLLVQLVLVLVLLLLLLLILLLVVLLHG